MAFQLIPTFPNVQGNLGDFSDDDTSEGEEELEMPKFDLNLSEEEGEENEDEDEESEEGGPELPQIGELNMLANLGKTKTGAMAPFPTGQRQQAAPVTLQTPAPTLPTPQAQPQIGGLRLAILPQTTAPVVPQLTTPVIPQQRPTTLLIQQPQVPQAFPQPTVPAATIAPFPGVVKTAIPTVTIPTLTKQPTPPKPAGAIPQLTGLTLAPKVPTTITQPLTLAPKQQTAAPAIPQLTGLVPVQGAPVIPNLQPAKPMGFTVTDLEAILAKMPGINVTGVTPAPGQAAANVEELLQKEADESPEDFEARSRLTRKLASIPDYKLNNATAIVAAHGMMKKSKLGVTYDPDVENALAYLTTLLQR